MFWSFFFCAWKGLEQHGRAIGEANNSPVGCCLVRGDHRLGMSIVEAVDRKISWLFCFVSHGCTVSARSLFSMSDYVGRCIALQSVPVFASGEQGQAEFCLHFRIGILEQFQKSRHRDKGLGQPVHQELCYRHGGRRPSTATPIRATFCRRTGACRSLSQPLFRVSRNQGVTHWTLQAKLCANERSAALWILPGRALENGAPCSMRQVRHLAQRMNRRFCLTIRKIKTIITMR